MRTILFFVASLLGSVAQAQSPTAITTPADRPLLTISAQGTQVYECRVGSNGALAWAFKEPKAELFVAGRKVGHHYAGPTWEHTDGSKIVGKVAASQPAPQATDIPWLRLSVVSHAGQGVFGEVATVQRVNTKGGTMAGACMSAGILAEAPYTADYLLLR